MPALFSFQLASAGYTLTIEDSDGNPVATMTGVGVDYQITDAGGGIYTCPLVDADFYTVKNLGTAIDGLTSIPYIGNQMAVHLEDTTPHGDYVYTETEIDALFHDYSSGKARIDWDNIYDKPTEFNPEEHDADHTEFAAGDAYSVTFTHQAHPTVGAAKLGVCYYYRQAGQHGALYMIMQKSDDSYVRIKLSDAVAAAPADDTPA